MIPADIDNFIIDNINYSFNCDNFIIIKGSFHKIPREIGNLFCLTHLKLSAMEIVDISALANLTSINYLNLCSNKIVDISALCNCQSLKNLYLYNNKIVDISVISNLTNLEVVNLVSNKIKNKIKFNDIISVYY